jgi:methylmalonyl-CoA mutase cobalamin-binding subunit
VIDEGVEENDVGAPGMRRRELCAIADDDAQALLAMGVARVYTPKDFELNTIMRDLVVLADPEQVAAE